MTPKILNPYRVLFFDPIHSEIKGPVFDVAISSNLDSGSIILGFRALGFSGLRFTNDERSQESLSLAAGQRA